MIIRQARVNDAADICAIINPLIRDTLITFITKERSEAEISAELTLAWRAYQVIELDGKVVGFATFSPFRDGPGYAHTKELSIHLAPQAQGKGMGRALMQKLEEVAVAQEVHVLVAGISASNSEAMAFHTACGFDQVGRMPEVGHKTGQWLDLILMQKILPSGESTADSGTSPG